MKVIRFLKPCHDKYTGEEFSPQQEKEFNNKRAAEIVKTGYAEYVEECTEKTECAEEE